MKPVIIESPYAGAIKKNTKYARACMLDSLQRGEAPFLSHLLYTQVLNDKIPSERKIGIEAGLSFQEMIKTTVVYADFGISVGMIEAIENAINRGNTIEYRKIL